jgi:ABC-type multidrug transport system fused ATPase/permease subunit
VIFVIDHGTVIERGTYEQLLAAGGLFSKLHEIQFRHEARVPS